MYSSSAWIFIGGLNYDLSEGDVITVFSQYGEIVNINLIRDHKTGKSKGFCFLCYENQKSTVLAVDNLNGIKLLNRVIRVDHVSEYKIPKEYEDMDDVTKRLHSEGCAPKEIVIKKEPKLNKGQPKHKRKRKTSSSSSSSSSSVSSDSSHRRRDRRRKEKKRHRSSERRESSNRSKPRKDRH